MMQREMLESEVVRVIGECTEHLCDKQEIAPDTAVADLMIDSLRMVQIVFELETGLGLELPEHALFQVEKVGDLTDLVRLAAHDARKLPYLSESL